MNWLPIRLNSFPPMRSSMVWIKRLRDGWVMYSSRAAFVRLRCRATATTYSSALLVKGNFRGFIAALLSRSLSGE